MKFLESAPERYDRGIQLLSRGRIADVYERIAALAASPGKRVLDLGCGTGGVALACAASGAHVVAVDSNAGMLEIARAKPVPHVLGGDIEWLELGIAEVEDRFGESAFGASTTTSSRCCEHHGSASRSMAASLSCPSSAPPA
jgi:demethylmenaquinone methyltransferase/2-methoxy-6-polyprenyl-1,4-benzoquinol methylase